MNILILGANSHVAHALAKIFARSEKARILLASRDMNLLRKNARDLRIRFGVETEVLYFDATDTDSHGQFYASLIHKPDIVIVAFGYLGDQRQAQENFSEAKKIFNVNFTGAASILEIVAKDFERRRHGFIIGIGSSAADRGKQSNYFYGAAKAAFAHYLSGLRNRLCKSDVKVLTVLPGFINTKMTRHLDLPEKLTATPKQVAEDIHGAYKRGKNIIYTRWYWRWIMMIIKSIPEPIFKRMGL